MEQCEYEAAAKFCQRAVDQEPTNVDALEMLATISLELGDLEKADEVRPLLPDLPARRGPGQRAYV